MNGLNLRPSANPYPLATNNSKKGLSHDDKPFFHAQTNPVIAMDPKVQVLLNGVALSVPAAPRQ